MSSLNKLVIFMHWDKDNRIDDYVLDYLKSLSEVSSEILFVSNTQLSEQELQKTAPFTINSLTRENKGLDFGAWSFGLDYLGREKINQYDEIVLVNDSCYAPLFPLSEMFSAMEKNNCDFWGITGNTQPTAWGRKIDYHLQSYFLVFRKSLVNSDAFVQFFEHVKSIVKNEESFVEIVLNLETKMTSFFRSAGFSDGVYISEDELKSLHDSNDFDQMLLNRPLFYWDYLIKKRCPIIKRKVFVETLKRMFVNHNELSNNRELFQRIQNIESFLESEKSVVNFDHIKKHMIRCNDRVSKKLFNDKSIVPNASMLNSLINEFGYKEVFSFYPDIDPVGEQFDIHLCVTKRYLEESHFKLALDELLKIHSFSENAMSRYLEAKVYIGLREYNKAIISVERALDFLPDDDQLLNLLGKLKKLKLSTPIERNTSTPVVINRKELVVKSGLVAENWYKRTYLESNSTESSIDHYLNEGYKLGNQPNPFFHSEFYRLSYLQGNDENPLVDYLFQGKSNGNVFRPQTPKPADITWVNERPFEEKKDISIVISFSNVNQWQTIEKMLLKLPNRYSVYLISTLNNKGICDDFRFKNPDKKNEVITVNEDEFHQKFLNLMIQSIDDLTRCEYAFLCHLEHDKTVQEIEMHFENLVGSNVIYSEFIKGNNINSKELIFSNLSTNQRKSLELNGGSWTEETFKYSMPWIQNENKETGLYDFFDFPTCECFWIKASELINFKTRIEVNGLNLINGKLSWQSFLRCLSLEYRDQQCTVDILEQINQTFFQSKPIASDSALLISDHDIFDPNWYLNKYPDVYSSGLNPLEHYCQMGWKEGKSPVAWFDPEFYCQEYLGGQLSENPLHHYIENGKSFRANNSMVAKIHKKTKNRLCLFAGYDSTNVIEPYVITYLKELSQYCDIYYLADCTMPEQELNKIKPYVKIALSERHGAYDFGSYSLLACKIVGWDIVSTYDEMIFANDSCYCIKSLGLMFETMDQTECDFWGVQGTKGMGISQKPFDASIKNTDQKIPINLVNSLNEDFKNESFYDFHIGSYFIAFRNKVLNDLDFRLAVASVKQEPDKADIVRKYEIGWTQMLLKKKYKVSTYLPFVYPFHPLFTEWYFESLKDGMPFLKRFLLTKNHYYIPDLYKWKTTLKNYTSQSCIEEIDSNIKKGSDLDFLNYIHNIKK